MLLVLLLLPSACAAEGMTAYCNPQTPPPVPAEHEAAGDDYFTDAVFIGDSMMDDVEMLDLFPTANFVCQVGMSLSSVNYKYFRIKGSDEHLTVFEAAQNCPHNKIYILLGGNSLDHRPLKTCMQEYADVMDQFIGYFPDSLIYIIAPPPGTEKAMQEKQLEARRFRDFRDFLLTLAEEKHLYFLDFYSLLLDDQGFMDWRYDCGDGQHPHRGGYVLMENLIRTHTVDYE